MKLAMAAASRSPNPAIFTAARNYDGRQPKPGRKLTPDLGRFLKQLALEEQVDRTFRHFQHDG
jgi:hypothetical protein